MDLTQFIDKYTGWLASTGVTAIPEIRKADFTPVVGYVQPTYIEWTNHLGSKLTQGAEILYTSESPEQGLIEVRAFFGFKPAVGNLAEQWRNYLTPATQPTPASPSIGPRVPDSTVAAFAPSGRVDINRKYFLQGGLDIPDGQIYRAPDGKSYLSVNPGSMFIKWLMEL